MEELTLSIEPVKQHELVTEQEQKNFLETNLGQAINFAVDVGLRAILPNFIEDSVIQIKDTIFQEGFSEGIKSVISSGIDLGKSVIGVVTGKFDNINQMQNAVQNGGIIDGSSELIDSVLNKIQQKGILSKNVISIIKHGKDILLDNITKNIEEALTKQIKEIEKIQTYSAKWKEFYGSKDFTNMEKQYKKIKNSLEKVMPIEQVIVEAREIENLHSLIKNNGKNFELSQTEQELAKKLVS